MAIDHVYGEAILHISFDLEITLTGIKGKGFDAVRSKANADLNRQLDDLAEELGVKLKEEETKQAIPSS